MNYYDLHLHSNHSHDGHAPVREMAAAALQAGLSGIAVTDHCDIEYYHTSPQYDRICASVRDTNAAREEFAGKLRIFRGVELGEAILNAAASAEVHAIASYDLILGSVHAVRQNGCVVPYSQLDFSPSQFSDEALRQYLFDYFTDLTEMVDTVNFDVLAHLTCPLRYITGKYHRAVPLEPFREVIDAILQKIIFKNIALELNCSGLNTDWQQPMPEEAILHRYRTLGGTLLTTGTDAHQPAYVGKSLNLGCDLLRSVGFRYIFYYESRLAQPVSLCGEERKGGAL